MSRREAIEKMLVESEDDVFLNFGLAMEMAKEEGSKAEALAQFDRVLELDPNYTGAHYHKGNTLIGLGRLDEARTVLLAGCEKAEANQDAHTLSELQDLLSSID